jgi:formamidopyrimidine-DNA glycosylase
MEERWREPGHHGGTASTRFTASLNLDEIRRLGPEPLDPRFTFSDFARLFEGRTGRIKALLMNPTFIAGIGNIYSDEILYAARIQPLGRVDQLVEPGLSSLYRCMRAVLRKAIRTARHGDRRLSGFSSRVRQGSDGVPAKTLSQGTRGTPDQGQRALSPLCPMEQKLYRHAST